MNIEILKAYVQAFLATTIGQAALAAARVFAATLLGCWLNAGSPIPPSSAQWAEWLAIAGPSSLSLVIVNYLGPWERRYGRNKKDARLT